jgi:hypothetical protein
MSAQVSGGRTSFEIKQDVARVKFDREQVKGALKYFKQESDTGVDLFMNYMNSSQSESAREGRMAAKEEAFQFDSRECKTKCVSSF